VDIEMFVIDEESFSNSRVSIIVSVHVESFVDLIRAYLISSGRSSHLLEVMISSLLVKMADLCQSFSL